MKKRTVSLAKYSWMGLLLAGSVLAVLAGCGGDDSDKSSAAEPSMETSYASKEDLPSCTSKREATIESTDDGKMYVCYDDSWKKIDYTESEVEDLPSCTEKRKGSVAFLSSTDGFVVCKNEKWQNQKNTDSDEVKESSSSVSPSSSGDVDEGSENGSSSSSAKTSYVEVKTKSDLIECNASNKDVRALVLKDSSYYTCNAKEWKKDEGYLGYDVVADRENLPMCNAGNAKQRVLAKKDSVFFVCDSVKWEPELAEGYLVQNASILGAAHKGPFKFDSPLLLREMLLRNDSLIYSGRKYVDEISSNKGDFVIPKVNMVYPYAELEVRGLWRNEITGDWSKDSMTLHVLTDLTKRTDVNINLLTHLEYDRAVALVNKGYSVYAAKKQADYEIMTALGFATTVEYSENLKTFVASTNSYYDANSTLMAISLLFIGNRSDAEIQKVVDEFRKDVADDGEWNGASAEATKAKMADWAESFDATSVRANVKTWNIVDIPSYENYLTIFWNNAYGLGGCASTRYGVVSLNTNKSSQNYNVHYICEANGWRKATDFEKDTYEWSDGKSGEVKKGNVTETYYVFENAKWGVAKNETALGICDSKRSGEIGKINETYYVCSSGKWSVATELQYDTYQFGAGKEGEVRKGKVNTSKYYVYENGSWRAAKNEAENTLGACLVSREGEIGKASGVYYICRSKNWEEASVLEYDTYGWAAGTEGEVKPGNVYVDNHYVYENGTWRACKNDAEYDLGACVTSREGEVGKSAEMYYTCKSSVWAKSTAFEYDTYGWEVGTEGEVKAGNVNTSIYYIYKNGIWQTATNVEADLNGCTYSREGEVGKSGNTYYICKSKNWRIATTLEYDTYGKTCLMDGSIVAGEITASNKYVCDSGIFREAKRLEIALDKGCVSYTEGDEIRKQLSAKKDSVYQCNSNLWIASIDYGYGSVTDSRDNKVYKTIVIGDQTWMAENLNYSDSYYQSSCYKSSEDSCSKYGRYYTWTVAMDGGGRFSNKGLYCGYDKTCTPIYPVRGICPEGWHLPSSSEWETLYSAMGSSPYAMQAQGFVKWYKATDDYGFSALPLGFYDGETCVCANTEFWSSSESSYYNAYYWSLGASTACLSNSGNGNKEFGKLVRCLKD